jgi:acyl dehydratase
LRWTSGRFAAPGAGRDTISFVTEIVAKRIPESRPAWGILEARNIGTNQRGETVFSLLAIAFVPRRA